MMKTEILIIGGGIAGLTMAVLLGQAGLNVIVIDNEKPKPSKFPGRTSALMEGSLNVLKATGIWDDLRDHAEPLKTMRIIDDSNSNADATEVEFHAKDIGYTQFGMNIPNDYIRSALIKKIQTIRTITHLCPASLESYQVDGSMISAKLNDNKTIYAALIIGADGRNSVVRSCANIDEKVMDYDQKAMTCVISHTLPHNNTSNEFHRSGGPFTTVPLPGDKSSIVWMEKNEDADRYLRLDKGSFENALQSRTRDLLGKIKLETSPESWPIIGLKASDIIAHRCALIAEAAHVLSPIGAQGLNLSLRDVAVLVEVLVDSARLGQDIGGNPVLKNYKSRRTVDISTRVFGVDSLNRLVGTKSFSAKSLRRLALKSINGVPLLKNMVMAQGLSPMMDSSRLMAGRKL